MCSEKKCFKLLKCDRTYIMRILILFQVSYMLVVDGFFLSFPFFSSFHYITDIVTLLLVGGIILDICKALKIKGKFVLLPLIVYSAVCVLSAAVNSVDPLLFIWASRNTFRFFIFFIACILYMKLDDFRRFIEWLPKLQFVNLLLVVLEYFYVNLFPEQFSKILQDHIGGIFGMEIGCNSRLNIFLCLVFIILLIKSLEKNKFSPMYFFVCSSVMICAAISELKVFFVEAVAICILCSVFYIKKIIVRPVNYLIAFTFFAVCVIMGMILMFNLYPHTIKAFADYAGYEKGAMLTYKIGRLHAFREINDLFFHDSISRNLFGYGFGNCEYSRFDFFTSDFYREFGDYNYRWFSHQMLYLETGLVGFVTFALFFVGTSLQGLKLLLKNTQYRYIAVFSIVISAVLFVNLWYNCNIRTDFAYISYFCLAFTPVLINEKGLSRT